METPHPLWLAARFVLLLAGLLGPGAALAAALRLPRSLALWFAGSALSLFATVLALQLLGLRISLLSLAAGVALIALAALLARRFRPAASPALGEPGDHWLTPLRQMGHWTPLYVLFWAAVLWRAWHEPLAGPDVEFRWGFLAEQMLRLGTLDYYPPRSAADFLSYFWAESVPPGAAALHAWSFACAGGAVAAGTVPAVVLQLWSLHEMLWHAAERLNGLTAARCACLAAAACPLLTWSVLIGQETGLTALALAGIACSAVAWLETRATGWAAAAGGFAVLGAAAREYGLVFPVLGAVALLAASADRRAWSAFATVAALALIWPLRTWLLTGNPLHSLALGNLFPVNLRFIAWINHDADALGAVLHSRDGWFNLGRLLMFFAPTALCGWLFLAVGSARRVHSALVGFAASLAILLLWFASVRYTNGGLFYSTRVMSPALTLGALAAGIGFAPFVAPFAKHRSLTLALVGTLTVAMLPATLALPQNPWRVPWRNWPAFSPPSPLATGPADATVALVQRALAQPPSVAGAPQGGRPPVVLADSPGFQRRFLPLGISVVPPWSPHVDWLFDPTLSPVEVQRQWRESGVRFVVVAKWQSNLAFFDRHSRWLQPPFRRELIGETSLTAVFSLRVEP